MNRGNGGIQSVILAAIGFAIGMAIMRYAFGDLFNPGVYLGVGIGAVIGLAIAYFFKRHL